MRYHKNQNMNQESRFVGMVTGRWARGNHVGRLRWSLGGCSSDCEGAYVAVYPVWLKEYIGLDVTFLFTVEGLTAGL